MGTLGAISFGCVREVSFILLFICLDMFMSHLMVLFQLPLMHNVTLNCERLYIRNKIAFKLYY